MSDDRTRFGAQVAAYEQARREREALEAVNREIQAKIAAYLRSLKL